MTLSAEMTASLTPTERDGSLAEAFRKINAACDEIAAAFGTIAQTVSVAFEDLNVAFEDLNVAFARIVTECLDSIDILAPREKLPRPPQKILKKYSYIPANKKHLPYQRRNY